MTGCPHSRRTCPPCATTEHLTALLTTVEHLTDSVMPGTARPWRTPQVSAERRAELDRQARQDRLLIDQQGHLPAHLRQQSIAVPPGESPAPYDLDIADLLSTILAGADLYADRACALAQRPCDPPASSAFADPTRHLQLLSQLQPWYDDDLRAEVDLWAQDMVEQAATSLGLVTDGQLLPGLCPWCDGRTPAHPAGGAKTLRVRTLLDRPVVVCEGGLCAPESADCGLWWRALPAWDLHNEGAWLADRISRADERRGAAA